VIQHGRGKTALLTKPHGSRHRQFFLQLYVERAVTVNATATQIRATWRKITGCNSLPNLLFLIDNAIPSEAHCAG
jgi:hypothetical protein